MRMTIRKSLLLVLVCNLACILACVAAAQEPQRPSSVYTDLSVTYAPERSEFAPGHCCFWMQGAGADGAVTLWKGLGIAVALTGDHASAFAPGIDLNKIAYLAGPRYTYSAWTGHGGSAPRPRYQFFGEGLLGGVHGFNGVYPAALSTTSSASAFALQAGGGFNYFLTRNVGLRVLEVDYVRTQLPDNAANSQNDLHLSFGVTYHVRSTSHH
jgi:outer membrane immunogenic protein